MEAIILICRRGATSCVLIKRNQSDDSKNSKNGAAELVFKREGWPSKKHDFDMSPETNL